MSPGRLSGSGVTTRSISWSSKARDAAEAEFLLHVDIDIGPLRQVARHHLQQPLVAGMAFHADAQRAARAARILAQGGLGVLQLRQQAIGHVQQVLPGLGELQPAALALPDRGAQRALELAHGVAQRRLGQVQRARGRGQRSLPVDLPHDVQMAAFEHGSIMNHVHWLVNIYHFSLMYRRH